MNEDFVPFQTLQQLKLKGYKQESKSYEGHIYDVLKWLREEKRIFVAINIGYCYESDERPFPTNSKMEPILKGYYYGIWELDNLNDKNGRSEYFEKPELATLAGIEDVIDNIL